MRRFARRSKGGGGGRRLASGDMSSVKRLASSLWHPCRSKEWFYFGVHHFRLHPQGKVETVKFQSFGNIDERFEAEWLAFSRKGQK